jgi:stage V sporulation protein SpoVS
MVNGQSVHAGDPAGWVNTALEALARDRRIVIQDGVQPELTLQPELLKAYVVNITGETRSANMVVRVHYLTKDGSQSEEIYRGTDNGVTWGGGQSESQSSFNIALMQILDSVHRDVMFRCGMY